MLLIYGSQNEWDTRSEDEVRTLMDGYRRLGNDLRSAGKLRGAKELQPIGTATSVQVRDGETVVSDGPFAETKEVLGGFY